MKKFYALMFFAILSFFLVIPASVRSEYMVMAESSSPSASPLWGPTKPIMGGSNRYTDEEWDDLCADFDALVNTTDLGTRDAVVAIASFLCNLDLKVPYANLVYQQRYDAKYAVYPYVGLNTQWGERYPLKNGQTLPPQGMYCSAFVEWVFINAGISYDFKITTDARYYKGTVMSTKKAFELGLIQPGDTVHTSQRRSETGRIYNHIGIVLEIHEDYILVAEERPLRGLTVTKASGNFARLDKVVINSSLYN